MLGLGLKIGVPFASISGGAGVDPDCVIEYDGVSLLVDGQVLTYGDGAGRAQIESNLTDIAVQYNRSSVQANGEIFTHQSTPRPLPSVKKIYANLTDLLVAHWKLDETSGTRYDSVGSLNLNPGSLDESSLAYIQGIIGNAADFSESTYLTSSSQIQLSGRESAISFWIKSSISGGSYAEYIAISISDCPSLYITDQGDIGAAASPGGMSEANRLRSNGTINNDTWRHIVITGDGIIQKLYIDGALDVTTTIPSSDQGGTFQSTNSRIVMINGNEFNPPDFGTSPFSLDSLSVWNRNLTEAEVTRLYNNGAALDLEDF
jgi:hypothetical protein